MEILFQAALALGISGGVSFYFLDEHPKRIWLLLFVIYISLTIGVPNPVFGFCEIY